MQSKADKPPSKNSDSEPQITAEMTLPPTVAFRRSSGYGRGCFVYVCGCTPVQEVLFEDKAEIAAD